MPHCPILRDGRTCGAPTFKLNAACPSCESRRLMEVPAVPPPVTRPEMPAASITMLTDFPRYRAANALLHHLWTKNVGGNLYDKREWEELEAALEDIARHGLGPHAPVPIAREYGEDVTASLGPNVPVTSMPPPDIMTPISRPKGK